MNTYRDNRRSPSPSLSRSLFRNLLQNHGPPRVLDQRGPPTLYYCYYYQRSSTGAGAPALLLPPLACLYLDTSTNAESSTNMPRTSHTRSRQHQQRCALPRWYRYSRSAIPIRVFLHVHTADTRTQTLSPHGNALVCLRRDPAFSRSGSPRARQNTHGGWMKPARGGGIATIYTHSFFLSLSGLVSLFRSFFLGLSLCLFFILVSLFLSLHPFCANSF